MHRDFNSDFKAERRVILFSIVAELILVVLSAVMISYSHRINLGWVVLVCLLGMLIGLISVGSYLWTRYTVQPEVEQREALKQEKVDLNEKMHQTLAQIGRLEEERNIIDRDEQNAISNRNLLFQQEITLILDQQSQTEITYRQTLQNALRQFQLTHVRNGLLTEKLSAAHLPGIRADQLPSDWLQSLAKHQIVSANDVIPEWLSQAGVTEALAQALLQWREEVEAEYRNTQPSELPENELQLIMQEYQEKNAHLEKNEIIAKAASEKDFFEIRESFGKQRERNRTGLSAARSALRGLEEKQKTTIKLEQTYTNIRFQQFFILALGSAFGKNKPRSAVRAGLVNFLVLGLLIFQGALGVQAMRNLLSGGPTPELEHIPEPSIDTPLPPASEFSCLPTDSPRQTGIVTRVVDGDTIDVQIDGQEFRVRYIGVDAPEPNEYYGGLSLNRNIQFVAGKEVTLIQDVSDTDSFDRLLRYVLVDDFFVNYQLLLDGDVRASAYPPDTACKATFETAEEISRAQQVGLWRQPATPAATPTIPPSTGLTETPNLVAPPCSCTANTLNCPDFTTHDEAQACYAYCVEQGAGDIHRLDGNGDGQACESLP